MSHIVIAPSQPVDAITRWNLLTRRMILSQQEWIARWRQSPAGRHFFRTRQVHHLSAGDAIPWIEQEVRNQAQTTLRNQEVADALHAQSEAEVRVTDIKTVPVPRIKAIPWPQDERNTGTHAQVPVAGALSEETEKRPSTARAHLQAYNATRMKGERCIASFREEHGGRAPRAIAMDPYAHALLGGGDIWYSNGEQTSIAAIPLAGMAEGEMRCYGP